MRGPMLVEAVLGRGADALLLLALSEEEAKIVREAVAHAARNAEAENWEQVAALVQRLDELIRGEPVGSASRPVSLRLHLTPEQSAHVRRRCARVRLDVSGMARRAALKAAGRPDLAERQPPPLKMNRPETGNTFFKVRLTGEEAAALAMHCGALKVRVSSFVRDQLLKEAGWSEKRNLVALPPQQRGTRVTEGGSRYRIVSLYFGVDERPALARLCAKARQCVTEYVRNAVLGACGVVPQPRRDARPPLPVCTQRVAQNVRLELFPDEYAAVAAAAARAGLEVPAYAKQCALR